MKTPYYVATVTNAYRRRIDGILAGTATPESVARLRRELDAASHRAYASGFYFGAMKQHAPDDGTYSSDCIFVGTVTARLPGGRIRVELRNRVRAGDMLEVLSPNALGLSFPAAHLTDAEGNPIPEATVPMALYDMNGAEGVEAGDLLRVRS